jgi:hypothetical protein
MTTDYPVHKTMVSTTVVVTTMVVYSVGDPLPEPADGPKMSAPTKLIRDGDFWPRPAYALPAGTTWKRVPGVPQRFFAEQKDAS